jgi:putative Mg2+ transporter-C (MgtC) family protein
MPLMLEWPELAERLALALLAGILIGLDRDEHGRPAGLRTTLLVCLAAAIAMIQVNLLLDLTGKAKDSFVMLDPMRLPLGILTGVGFIGGGAILRRENGVIGVTTAATLWFVTVIGLCFGGGQIGLGLAGTVLALIVLQLLKRVENLFPRDHRARLVVAATTDSLVAAVEQELAAAGMRITRRNLAYENALQETRFELAVQWRARGRTAAPPGFLAEFARRSEVRHLAWYNQDPER